MPNPSQELPASSKTPNDDLKDMDVLCTFKVKIESQNLDHECIKDQWPYSNQDQNAKPQSGTFSILESPNEDFKDIDILYIFKISIDSQNLDYKCMKNQLPFPNQDEDAKPNQKPSASSKCQMRT